MKAMTNSPRSSNRWVLSMPPQENVSQAAKSRETAAHPVSTIKRRRLIAINRGLKNQPAASSIPKQPRWSLIELRRRRFRELAGRFPHRHGELLDLAGSNHFDLLRGADRGLAKSRVQVLEAIGHRAVQGEQRVPLHQASFVGRAL